MFRHIYLLCQWIGIHRNLDYLQFRNIGKILREYQRIVKLYNTGDRHYHTLEHIENVLRFIDAHWPSKEGSRYMPLVKLALFYHDCVYDVKSKTNEEDSYKEFAVYAKSMNFHSWLTEQVEELILLTKSHHLPSNAPMMHKVMNDADMSIFLASPETYRKYAVNIWREYSVFGREAFLKGRLAFLDTVDPATIFHTDLLNNERCLTLVRFNLQYEKTMLTANPDSLLS